MFYLCCVVGAGTEPAYLFQWCVQLEDWCIFILSFLKFLPNFNHPFKFD